MLDLKTLRADTDSVRAALARRNDGSDTRLDQALDLDTQWRQATAAAEEARAELNAASKGRTGAPTEAERQEMSVLAEKGREASDQESKAKASLDGLLAMLPNPPAPDAADEDTVLREVGESGAQGRDHLDLAGPMIDMEAAARLSGSRFAYLRGPLVMVELALVRYALELLGGEGFEPVIPPVLVREEALFGTGFMPDTEQQIYKLADDDLYLTGTSEVALAGLNAGQIIEQGDLPLRYAGFSPCFRREAGSAGKDTRGVFRVHQFDKVEMYSLVPPDQSEAEHERILALEERILSELGIPYRVVNIGVAELGASAAKKYDCEAWLPGQGRWRELTSCSNTTDFQARRLNIRMRPEGGGKPEILHTLNGTAVAVGRTLIALLENGQREDGTVEMPQVLVERGAPAVLSANPSA
ncbi:MAG: serine--tRNA ligase [Actinomycetes bacterium]|uniref:serine--tRNA ligase n=1 Tax=freshwater metagenome TaxID=449393 RepID=A0A6J7EI44_9ZZZZ|nr:serine--tRNA ligase [Actinomycetota bacterium]